MARCRTTFSPVGVGLFRKEPWALLVAERQLTSVQSWALVVQSAVSASASDNVALTPHGVALVPQNAVSTAISNNGLGPELITDPGFDTGTNWTLFGATALTGSQLVLPTSSYEGANFTSAGGVIAAGDVLLVDTDAQDLGGGSPYFHLGDSGDQTRYVRADGAGILGRFVAGPLAVYYAVSQGTNGTLLAGLRSESQASTAEINSFSVKKAGPPMTLGTNITLTIAGATSLSTVTTVTLAAKTALAVQNAISASQVDGVALVAKTALAPAAAISLTQTSNVVLSPKTALAPADATSASQTTSPTLVAKTALVVANVFSLATTDNVLLGPRTALQVNDAVSLAQADQVTLSARWALLVASALSTSSATNVTLAVAGTLAVNDNVSLSQADLVTLVTADVLQVADAISLSTVDHVLIHVPTFTPIDRRLDVLAVGEKGRELGLKVSGADDRLIEGLGTAPRSVNVAGSAANDREVNVA